ncbi:MAG: tyrosine-type recombinase/integrase [Leptospiraceae bacterium]|nr:tyrosine-type recombinase/integrase [Leptospiraceae bacterium]
MEKQNSHFQDFLNYLEYEKNYSNHTLSAYFRDIQDFLVYCEREGLSYLEIDHKTVRSYFSHLHLTQKLDKKSQSRKLSALRSFYKYLFQREIISTNPVLYVSFPKIRKNIPKHFTPIEMETILETEIQKTPLIEKRNRAILEVLYSTGMRVFELVNARLENFSEKEAQIKILGKRNKERFVFLGKPALATLCEYLELRGNPKKGYVFLNARGDKLTTRGVQYILEQFQKETGFRKKITPHKFRHTFATDLLNEGADIRHVQEMLGHESLSSTQIYLSVTKDRLKEIYRKAHPHAKSEKK